MILDIPLSIFNDSSLTKNELLIEYLKLYQNLPSASISALLDKDVSTVSTLLERAKKKRAQNGTFLQFNVIEGTIPSYLFREKSLTYDQIISKYKSNIIDDRPYKIPISIFKNKETYLSLLVKYCRDILKLKYKEIGTFLKRSEKSLINVYARVKDTTFEYDLDCLHVPIFLLLKPLSVKENLFLYLSEILNYDYEDISISFDVDKKEVERIIFSAKRKRRGELK